MELRKAHCGHWISADAEPVGHDVDRPPYPVYLCAKCAEELQPSQHKEPVLTKKA